jgi:capsular exopolysaccharide synthesis family protein
VVEAQSWDNVTIETEIAILRSPALKPALVDKLDLTNDPEWNWTLREPPAWKQSLSSLLSPVLRPEGQSEAAATPVDPAWLRTVIASSVGGAFTIRRQGFTYVIEIFATSRDPVKAQQLANGLADIYIASKAEEREEAVRKATASLAEEIQQLREEVRIKEAAVEAFRAQTGLNSADGRSLLESQIVSVQSQLLEARAQLRERQGRYRQLRELQARGASLESIAEAQTSPAVLNLRDRLSDVSRRLTEAENKYLPTHPDVHTLRAEHEEVLRQIAEEVERIAVSLEQEVNVARQDAEVLEGELGQLTERLQQENADGIQLRELQREAEAAADLLSGLLERLQEVETQTSMSQTDVRLVSHAEQAGWQIAPNFRVSLALAVMAGGFCGLVAGVIAELLDRSIRSREEVEAKIGYPAITSIPSIGKGAMRSVPRAARTPPGYLVEKPMSAFTEALRVLRTVIVHSHLGSASRVVAIASALPGEGKTTVAMSLARVAALSGQRVIVVDCDLRKQSISRFLNVKPEMGLLQALTGETTWREALVRDERSQADILPIAGSSFTSLDIFGSDSMELLLSELRENYEIIVLDCPPLFAVADARVICALADSVVIVARMGKSAMDAVRMAVDQVVSAGGKVAGVALNRVPVGGFGRFAYGDLGYSYELRSYYSSS